ncbi:MAG TPA: NAD(P)/FAD-dependent oxidoreductase [Arenibaculum sp.]|nr:NAD(P)/FAD-dependent oxidoreductase [Arenibaculum sp.]
MFLTNRRRLLQAGAAAVAVVAMPSIVRSANTARVVVIGGGFGGATAAKYLRQGDPSLHVTLVQRDARFVTCPFSNLVLGGLRDINDIAHGYDALRGKHGIDVVIDEAVSVDPGKRTVALQGGGTLEYDRLVLSPGIDLRYDALEGYDEAAARVMPHAWQAGPQTTLLRSQIEAMPDGGLVLICPPANPFRCPPGPYERASMIAHYLKTNKPKSKIMILDSKGNFSKQGLFTKAWQELYPGMIEWLPAEGGGKVLRADPGALGVETDFGLQKGNVVNVIPPQRAGRIAQLAGCTDDSGWCPVDTNTFESKLQPGIHVIGDASVASPMPKSATAANSQAKAAAAAIVALLKGDPVTAATLANTCYSLVAPDQGISVTTVYANGGEGLEETGGGLSPLDASEGERQLEAAYTEGWYRGITLDAFG